MSTRGIVARGKPAYDDATEIYGRSAHPFGLAPERLLMEAACNDRAPAAAVPPVVDEMDGELTPPIPPFLCLPTTNPPVQLTNVTRPRMTVH